MNNFIVLIITFILVLVALFVFYALRRMAQSAQKVRDGFAFAIPATAKVLHLHNSISTDGYDCVDVSVTFDVLPPAGEPYPVKTTWSVDPGAVSKIQVGSMVAVRIDKDDHRKIYSAETWAQSLELLQNSLDDSDD